MITLDALQAQTVGYVSANYQPGDEHGSVVVDACRVILGEPGNYSDPRRFLVFAASEELANIWEGITDYTKGRRVKLRDFYQAFGEQGYAAGKALYLVHEWMENRDHAPDDKQWHLVVYYLENVRGGVSETWEDLDQVVDLYGFDDFLDEWTEGGEDMT